LLILISIEKEGKDYLQYVLGDFLRQVVADTAVNGLDFNIDNSYCLVFLVICFVMFY